MSRIEVDIGGLQSAGSLAASAGADVVALAGEAQGVAAAGGGAPPATEAALGALASSLGAIQGSVAATDAPGWSGSAASAFDGAVQRDAVAVGTAAGAFEEAAGALTM